MSLRAIGWAWEQDLQPTAKLVLLALAECVHGRDDGDSCYPGQRRLAEMCGVSDRQIRNVLRELEERGLIETLPRPGSGGGRRSNVYRLAMPADGSETASEAPDATAQQPEMGFRQSVSGCGQGNRNAVSGGNRKSVSGGKRNVVSEEPEGGTGRVESEEPTQISDRQEPLRDSKQATASSSSRVRRQLTEAQARRFERFWAVYPRRVAKGEARKAWRQLDPDDQLTARIVAAVERDKRSEQWRRDGGRYIPHPATWLRRESWDDEEGVEIEPLAPAEAGGAAASTMNNLRYLFGGADGGADLPGSDELPVRRLQPGDHD